jgi:anthranilate synthase component 2
MILLIDNYDSFTFNLYQFIGQIRQDILVKRNDQITLEEIEKLNPDKIIISPGPGIPQNAGICIEVIKKFGSKIPILGVCLGHQAIGYAFGGKVIRAKEIMHGKVSKIKTDEENLFKGIYKEIVVMRYHSLIVEKETLPSELEITAQTEDGVIMGLKHKKYPIYGVQFHPESIGTKDGFTIIKNFIEGVKIC